MTLLFVFLGVVVNVAVAWGCALASEYPEDSDETAYAYRDDGSENHISFWRASVGSGGYYAASWSRGMGDVGLPAESTGPAKLHSILAWWGLPRPAGSRISPTADSGNFELHGWPVPSLWCDYEQPEWDEKVQEHHQSAVGAWTLGRSGRKKGTLRVVHPKALPLRPMWSGFIINTLFYTVILWLVIRGPFALRRFVRRRAGTA